MLSLRPSWHFHSILLGPREVPDPISPTCDSSMPLTLFSSLWAVLLGPMWPGGFLLQAVAAPPLWFLAHSPRQPLCQPRQRKAWGLVGHHLGCGGVPAAAGAAAARRGLGRARCGAAGPWGWLPGQELCPGAAPRAAGALRAGLELGVCLKRKLRWAGLLATGALQRAQGAAGSWLDKLPLAQLLS